MSSTRSSVDLPVSRTEEEALVFGRMRQDYNSR